MRRASALALLASGQTSSASLIGVGEGAAADRTHGFRHACDLLGARRALLLDRPDIFSWRLPVEVLIDQLRQLTSYCRVYTHSPFEAHLHLGTLCYLTALARPLSLTGNALYASQTEMGIHTASAVVSHGGKAPPVQSNMSWGKLNASSPSRSMLDLLDGSDLPRHIPITHDLQRLML
jgi:hypothetical protein